MDNEEIALVNGCTDLVGLRKNEVFPPRLLQGRRPGEWSTFGSCARRRAWPPATSSRNFSQPGSPTRRRTRRTP